MPKKKEPILDEKVLLENDPTIKKLLGLQNAGMENIDPSLLGLLLIDNIAKKLTSTETEILEIFGYTDRKTRNELDDMNLLLHIFQHPRAIEDRKRCKLAESLNYKGRARQDMIKLVESMSKSRMAEPENNDRNGLMRRMGF